MAKKMKMYPTKRRDMKIVNRPPSMGGVNSKTQRKLYRKLGKVANKTPYAKKINKRKK